MIDWINQNDGFLMVIITFIYVVATVIICIFNGKSAKASNDQIIAAQKQQEQNAGLQLYAIRREIINKIGNHQFDDVFWDIPLLFNEKLFDEFANLGMENKQLNDLKIKIKWFEDELGIILPENKKMIILSQITVAKLQKEYKELGTLIEDALTGIRNNVLALNFVDEYIENLKRADDLQTKLDGKTLQLIMKLQAFTRESIQLKGNRKNLKNQ